MKKIYFDNASTTFPKPKETIDAVCTYMSSIGCNIGRGNYTNAYSTEEIVFETRQLLSDFFHGPDCKNVIFTKNVTESLNILIKGFLKPGDHVLVSSMEHNAVMRPLVQLKKCGVTFSRIPCTSDGSLCMDRMEDLLQPNTKAVIMMHASNVCGTVLPLHQVGVFCRKHNLKFIVDAAQTAGVIPVNMKEMNIDALAFTGHKGLLGPQGIGGFLLQEKMIPQIDPLLSGGTGSISHTEEIPAFMPDRFEPGTMNLPGIFGLHASLQWILSTGVSSIYNHEMELTSHFIQGLQNMIQQGYDLKIIGKQDTRERTGVVSIQTASMDIAQLAFVLDEEYQIMTRVGLHCAPSAHKTLGTFPTGTLRFSFGWWNTLEEVDTALEALHSILKGEDHGI